MALEFLFVGNDCNLEKNQPNMDLFKSMQDMSVLQKFKVIFRLLTGSNIKKYKLDTIQFTVFILEDPVIGFGLSCLIAK